MRITFILPGIAKVPVGGYKVVYEYADRLSGKGHDVTICHTVKLPHYKNRKFTSLRYFKHLIFKTYTPGWFTFKNKVDLAAIPEIRNEYIPDGDVIVATLWATAYGVKNLRESKGKKFYFIQGYEIWDAEKKLVEETYRFGFNNIVISSWLREVVTSVGGSVAACIPNGIDFEHFRCVVPTDERNPFSILMMYHEAPWKNSNAGIEALEVVRQKEPEVTATLFGVYKRPHSLPSWIEYFRNPSQGRIVDLYNKHSIFLSPTKTEGFSLPPAEAMACGCAVVSADNNGVREYLIDGETGIISQDGSARSLADDIVKLLQNMDLRAKIASRSIKHIKSFSWEKAVNGFEKVLLYGSS